MSGMNLLLILANLVLLTSALAEDCDSLGIALYEDLGCKPNYDVSKPCPVKYTCPYLETSDKGCTFRGKQYKEGDTIEDDLTVTNCKVGCLCTDEATFICAIMDCFEWRGRTVSPGCRITYSLDTCCSTGEACPVSPSNGTEKCVVNGMEYEEDERFYPENSCKKCICQKREPICKRATCAVELMQSEYVRNRCAPLYYKDATVLCCPDLWTCSTGSEEIEGEPITDDTCAFGTTTLYVGQKFEKEESGIKMACECVLPPLLTCRIL